MSALVSDVRIIRIPNALLSEMWPHCVPYLLKGLTAATDTTLEEIGGDVLAGRDDLWTIFVDHQIVGAFLTSVFLDEDEERKFLGVYGLGGAQLMAWADDIDRAMQADARALGLSRIRFCGREAWSRVLPDLARVGKRDGATIFERAV